MQKEKYRDTFFRFYFSDKARLLDLCNALTGEDATDPNEIEINTLDETFFSKRKNDISCIFRDRLLILIEHQTTLNENMPLRFLLYLAKLLNKIYDKEFSRQIYEHKAIELPRPEFYVLYNGRTQADEFFEMKLSKAFKEWTDSLELKVKFYNINHPHNRDLLKKSLSLDGYCTFVERVKLNKRSGMDDRSAFYEAYKYCKATRAEMKSFLLEHEWELFDMIITEYNEEWDKEASFNDGFRRGKDIGREEEKIAMIKTLLKVHNPIEYIVAATGWTEEEILKLALTPRETPMTIDEMRRELQRRLNKNRFAHSIGVANTAVKLAKRFGVDEQKAYVAGLLHDCARQFENDALPAQAEIRGIEIGEVERAMPLLLHAYISAKMISEVYGVNDAEISQAIYRHTVGAPDMTPLDKIIYFADMIEPNRNYPGVEKLRALAETAELNEIMLTAFSESIIFVVQKNSLVHPDTVAARNFLLLNK